MKKEEIFENELFSKEEIDSIDNKIELNLGALLESNEYIELNRKFKEISLKLGRNLNDEQRKILYEYQKIEIEITSYQNCLAYYLGCKAIIDIDKLK